jgi:hypothetical protein
VVAAKESSSKGDQARGDEESRADEARSTIEADTGRKPVWTVETQGPVPADREGVYDVVGPSDPSVVADAEEEA